MAMMTVEQAVRRAMNDLVRYDQVNIDHTADHVMTFDLPAGTSREDVKAAVEKNLERLKRERPIDHSVLPKIDP